MKPLFFFIFALILVGNYLHAAETYDSIKILVKDQVITSNEIEFRAYELAQARTGRQPSIDTINEYRKQAIELLIEEALLDSKADELMIFISEEELDYEIERFQEQRKINQNEFEELLERQNINLSDFRKNYRRQLRRNNVILREVRSKVVIDENTIKAGYENSTGFELVVRARHILLIVGKNAPDENVSQVRQKIMELRKRIIAGEPFEKIADQYSEDPSVKSNHGDLGFFKQRDMVKEFSDAAFSLSPRTLSEPVRSPFGFHLIEVMETKNELRESFESVKNKLMQQEYQKQFEEKYAQYLAMLKIDSQIVYK
jgi:parvulin-like peptidyl-prolyl isomerase